MEHFLLVLDIVSSLGNYSTLAGCQTHMVVAKYSITTTLHHQLLANAPADLLGYAYG
jgi:hypothetical protein